MKRGDVLATIADLAGEDLARRQSAIVVLESMPQDRPLPYSELVIPIDVEGHSCHFNIAPLEIPVVELNRSAVDCL